MNTMQECSYQANVYVNFQKETLRLQTQAAMLHQFELAVLQRHGLKDNHRVLDIGCGQGFLTHIVSRFLIKGSIDGVDSNPSFIEEAQKANASDNLAFYCSSVMAFRPRVSYDFIYARLLFQHLSDPLATIHHLKKYLRPGGILCIIDVNDEWLFLEPRLPAFDTLVKESIRFQHEKGGDRLIAKKLPGYLQQAGFDTPQLEIVSFSSVLVGMELFLEIAVSFRANYAYRHVNGQELYQNIRSSVLPHAETFFGLMGVTCLSAGFGKNNDK